MSNSRTTSPARSQGVPTPRRYKSRGTRSVGSPARSIGSIRLSAIIQKENINSFVLSPLGRRSVLNDDTDIELAPERKSWWKHLDENSRVVEVLQDENNQAVNMNNCVEDLMDVEVLSQEKRNYTLDLPDSSDGESIASIVLPQRKLFTQKDLHTQNKYGQLIENRETLVKLNKTNAAEKSVKITKKNLFSQNKPRTRPAFPDALLQISLNKTAANKTKEMPEVKNQARNLFGNGAAKRKNMFADFIASESEDEILDIQPKVFGFNKKPESMRRGSSNSRGLRDSPTNMSLLPEMDDWKMLPSSTMVEYQLEAVVTPVKRLRLSRLESRQSEVPILEVPEPNDLEEIPITTLVERSMGEKSILTRSGSKIESQKPPLGDNDKEKSFKTAQKSFDENPEEPMQTFQDTKNQSRRSTRQNTSAMANKQQKSPKISVNLNDDEQIVETNKSQAATDKNATNNKEQATDQNAEINEQDEEENLTLEMEEDDDDAEQKVQEENQDKQEASTDNIADKMEENKHNAENEVENEEENEDVENEEENADVEIEEENEDVEIEEENEDVEIEEENEELENEEENEDMENEEENDEQISENKEDEEAASDVEHGSENAEIETEEQKENADSEVEDDGQVSETEENDDMMAKVQENIEQNLENPDEVQSDVEIDDQEEEDEIEVTNEQEDEVEHNKSHAEINQTIEENQEEDLQNSEELNESQMQDDSDVENYNHESGQDDDENDENEAPQDESEEINESQEIELDATEIEATVQGESNKTQDTTGRNRNKNENITSPEAILHNVSNEMESFSARGRNTSIRKTKSMMVRTIQPSLAPHRDSTGISDGTKNSSAEGSGWDSHRVTRKTIRQTFGKEFTPRKSLRALVMEKSAKRQTGITDVHTETMKHPQANSTEFPEDSVRDYEEIEEPVEQEISLRTRQTTLEMYLQNVKKQNMEKKMKIDEAVRNSIKARPVEHQFKVPSIPRRPNPKQSQKKPKAVKSFAPVEDLPLHIKEDLKYKPPKRFRPSNAGWITKRLYKFLETKLEPTYDYKARVRAEKLVIMIYDFTKQLRKNWMTKEAIQQLKHEMARLQIVRTHFEFYEFFNEFMPREVRVKVIPDIVNGMTIPRQDVFSDIIR